MLLPILGAFLGGRVVKKPKKPRPKKKPSRPKKGRDGSKRPPPTPPTPPPPAQPIDWVAVERQKAAAAAAPALQAAAARARAAASSLPSTPPPEAVAFHKAVNEDVARLRSQLDEQHRAFESVKTGLERSLVAVGFTAELARKFVEAVARSEPSAEEVRRLREGLQFGLELATNGTRPEAWLPATRALTDERLSPAERVRLFSEAAALARGKPGPPPLSPQQELEARAMWIAVRRAKPDEKKAVIDKEVGDAFDRGPDTIRNLRKAGKWEAAVELRRGQGKS